MNTENSQQDPQQQQGWLYLTGSGDDVQQHGPFDVEAMKVLFQQNYITEHALVWTAGQDEWQPLKACQELYEQLVFPDQEQGRPPKKKKKIKDADLAEFEAEIAAVEAGQAEEGSPPPEERTFVDDDGTQFVWDPALRKFRPEDMPTPQAESGTQPQQPPKGDTAPGGEYTQDMMTFGGIEEKLVTLEEARAEQEAELLQAEGVHEDDSAATTIPQLHTLTAPAVPSGDAKEPTLAAATAAAPLEVGRIAFTSGAGTSAAGGSGGEMQAGPAADSAQTGVVAANSDGATESKPKKNNNTSVYVEGIPDDATEDEMAEEFARCGVIKLDADGNPRIKLYKDKETGLMKGDALVTFLQRPSVSLACTLMHGRALRPLKGGRPMSVQEAQFEPKADSAAATAATVAATSGASKGGQSNNTKKGGKGGGKGKGKKAPSQVDRVLGWGGFDDKQKATEVTVVFTNFFTIDDMSLSPDLEGVLSEYIIRRCKDLGAIERVRVFRKAASGVATARFRVPDDAQTAIQRFSGTAVIWGMFAAAEMTKRGPERVAEVEEDVLERAVSLGVRVVGEGGLGVLYGEAGHGMVAVGCADIAGMQRLQLGFDGAAYDGRILRADAVEAFLWDGETKPESYGAAAAIAAPTDEARLEAYAAELEGL